MQRRGFLRWCSVAALTPALGVLPGCEGEPLPAGIDDQGSDRVTYGRDGRGFRCAPNRGSVHTLDPHDTVDGSLELDPHSYPVTVTSSESGLIAVVDVSSGRVELRAPSGQRLKTLGRPELLGPRDVIFADDALLLVADTIGHAVVGFDTSGQELFRFGELGQRGAQLNGPRALALAEDGTLHVADLGNARIHRFALDGRWLGAFGRYGKGPGEFLAPRGLAFDRHQRLYVVDAMRGDVQVFREGELVERLIPDGIPVGVTTRPDGTVYVALG